MYYLYLFICDGRHVQYYSNGVNRFMTNTNYGIRTVNNITYLH